MCENRFYICNHCGNVIGLIEDSGVSVECCGEPMEQFETYDTEKGSAEILLDGASYAILSLRAPAPLGLSYLHVQTLAEKQDFESTLLRLFEKTK